MKYKFIKNEQVWANTRLHGLPWRAGYILDRFKMSGENFYNFMPNIRGLGHEISEKDMVKEP